MKLTKELLSTTEAYIKKLEKAGLQTVQDLLFHFPRDIEDKTKVCKNFSELDIREKGVIVCKIVSLKSERTKFGKQLFRAVLVDESGYMCEALWFHRNYILKSLKKNTTVQIFGKPKYERGKFEFLSPEIEIYTPDSARVEPVYPEVWGISSAWFEKKIHLVLPFSKEIVDILPKEIVQKHNFFPRFQCIEKIHNPESQQDFFQARNQLAYEEIFLFQQEWLMRKREFKKLSKAQHITIHLDPEIIKSAIEDLPFSLTNDQKIVLFQVLKDMEGQWAMNRLVQWDVGTGKTIVAFLAVYHAITQSDCQAAFLVPTSILASQHYKNALDFFTKKNISVELLVGATPKKQKEAIKDRLVSGETKIIIGTHALLQEDVFFQRLGCVIIDEQHRFGVEQRKKLTSISENKIIPHVLSMSATPIPRSLALSLFGDQDLSIISEYPAGRKPIHTVVVKEHQKQEVYEFIRQQVSVGRQIYWVSPLVEESSTLEVENVHNMTEKLREVFPDFSIEMLHGKISPKEKDAIMGRFTEKEIDILSSTSVIEVGVDNSNATIMCIEDADRFGLSQLHQFRGRVGRWEHQSYCYLFTGKGYKNERLKTMEKSNDGFYLSQVDLELRGPGEVYGVRQSGLINFKIASFKDLERLQEIYDDVQELFEEGKE